MIQRGKLIALTKEAEKVDADGLKHSATHRPIMISTVLYRLAARIVSNEVLPAASNYLSPLQLGVATPGAMEAIIHNIREALMNNPDLAALPLDIINAFNEVSRSGMIITVMTKHYLKRARAFVKMSYGSPTPILMPDSHGIYLIINDLMSEQGLRQGNPASNILFACALDAALKAIQSKHPTQANLIAYLSR